MPQRRYVPGRADRERGRVAEDERIGLGQRQWPLPVRRLRGRREDRAEATARTTAAAARRFADGLALPRDPAAAPRNPTTAL